MKTLFWILAIAATMAIVPQHEPKAAPAEWVRPPLADLLSGRACIPLDVLLSNRPMSTTHHSYSRPVNCPKGGTQ
jgi:hypothetical protein